jgi:hypothetical protein
MPLTRLSAELLSEILYQIVVTNAARDDYDFPYVVKTCITPFVFTYRMALQCWIDNGHVVLHRAATTLLAATEAYRKSARRNGVLARFRKVAWVATYIEATLERRVSLVRKVDAAIEKSLIAWYKVVCEEDREKDWKRALL